MRTTRLLARYLVGFWLVAAVAASPAVGKTLALYEAGKPVADGATLSVESAEGLCGSTWEPEKLVFPARMTANEATPVVVSIEPPGMESCAYHTVHPAQKEVELKEISLSASGTTVIGVFRGGGWDEKFGFCSNEFRNASGRPPRNKHQAKLIVRSVGKGSERCGGKTIKAKFEFILRGSNGNVLETRYI